MTVLDDLQRVARDSRSKNKTRWWFHFFLFSPLLGEDFQFDQYFSNGLKPPTRKHLFALRLKVGACQVLPRQSQGRCGGTLWIAVPRGNGYCRWVPHFREDEGYIMDIRGLYKEGTKLLEEYQNHPP